METLDPLEAAESLDLLAPMEISVPLASLELLELLDQVAHLELVDKLATRDHPAHLDPLADLAQMPNTALAHDAPRRHKRHHGTPHLVSRHDHPPAIETIVQPFLYPCIIVVRLLSRPSNLHRF
jgi:hypothetical protein